MCRRKYIPGQFQLWLGFLVFYIGQSIAGVMNTTEPASTEFKCTSVGKFVDELDTHRYHQCFYLFGTLTYIHNICPFQTCFDPDIDYCTVEACKTTLVPGNERGKAYYCKDIGFKCTKKGVFAGKDSSIYFKCSKIWGKWVYICYTCNKKHKTCYDNQIGACIPNGGKPCSEKGSSNATTALTTTPAPDGSGGGDEGSSDKKTLTYDCEGYEWFPCYKLGIGLHQFPGDKSVYMQCTKNRKGLMEGKCHTCPRKGNSCFVERIDQCIERCGKGSPHKPYNCSTFTIDDVECQVEGLVAHSTDTSVYFDCVKQGTKWDIQCHTCSNGKTKTCFSELQQACVTYSGAATEKSTDHKCPPITIIDGPQDTTDVGTADKSLTWDCAGYNEQSFPCAKFEQGVKYASPGDRSVWFTCSGSVAECHSCPSETWSCFDEEKEECLRDCVPRVHIPYDCRSYDTLSYPCTEPGFFAGHNDTSVYFNCIFLPDGGYKSLCYACSSGDKKTCYSNEEDACITNGPVGDNRPCGTIENLDSNPDKGTKESSLTYSKEGYSETSFPCSHLESGEYENHGDMSTYVTCKENGETEIHVCPEETRSCYDKETKTCIENCGEGLQTTTVRPVPSYSCQDITWDCTEEDIFPYPSDTSIYIKCTQEDPDGPFKALCYSCNSVDQTCFSAERKTCAKFGTPCGDKESQVEGGGDPHMSYKCDGYTQYSFPCADLGPGFHGMPGDLSTFFECYTSPDGQFVGKCHNCLKSVSACFDDDKGRCIKNCGKGELHKPYDCSTYNSDTAYPCTKPGYFGNSFDTSLYFLCTKVNGTWKSYCYGCNFEAKTCFNEEKQACVLNGGNACGNTTMPVKGGSKIDSLTYSCDGYNKSSFPCAKLGPGTYVSPGDQSVYWNCKDDGDGECQACDAEKKECYSEEAQKCVERCGRGAPPKPYNCSSYNRHSFNCKQEGLYANPTDSSIYFRCLKSDESNNGWELDCFTCNSRNRTCFDDIGKTCVDNNGRPCGGKTIEVIKEIREGGVALVPKSASRVYTCLGYEGYQFPCRKPGNFTCPGDRSIYYTCNEQGERILPHCRSCPRQQKSCFIEDKNKCVDNCGQGALVNGTIRPFDCSGYSLSSFPCQKEGLFANPQDPTVFFHCLKNKQSKWESRCYACNSLSKSCFSNKKQRCIIGCVPDDDPAHEDKEISLVYGDNCRGYSISAVPCASLMSKHSTTQMGRKTYFEHLGDKAVYFSCVQKEQKCFYPCDDYVPVDPSNPLDVGPAPPYDCRYYTDDSYPCVEEGIFVNPVETSILFQCVRENSVLHAICFTCNSKLKTCMNEAKLACFYTDQESCGTTYMPKNYTAPGKTYDCEGYSPETSLPCSRVGAGTWAIPGDKSVYFTCEGSVDAGYTGVCHTCSREKAACFDEHKGECVDHCILKPYKPYSCEIYGYDSFHCVKEGFFAQTFDSSTFFQCVKEGKYWKALCYSCNKHLKTCFSNKKLTCLTKGGNPCGEGDPHDTSVGGTEEGSRHHTCQGYNDLSFPCSYYRAGKYGSPADQSIFFNCVKLGDKWLAECGACPRKDDSCFDGLQKTCVANCGKGSNEPYSCHSYDFQAITCKKEGYYKNSKDSSVFFKCVKSSDVWSWKTYCFSCNSKMGTCFDEITMACLTNDGMPCKEITDSSSISGGKPVDVATPTKGTVEDSRSYDCEGYTDMSLPCNLYGPGKWAHPADPNCVVVGGELFAECHHCDASRHEYFVDKVNKCVPNFGLGPHKPWECTTRRFKCVTEGLFANFEDNSVFYKCQRKADGTLESQCFTCNNGIQKTCFSQSKQVCLKIPGKSCGKDDPASIDSTMTEEKSRTYDCTGYLPHQKSFPCSKYGPGIYATFAEKSVYFECTPGNVAECKACNSDSRAIFDPVQKKCVPNSGKGPHQPYSCYTYDDQSYKCKKSGYFANPKDTSIYFKCVQKGDKWESHCYTCSKTKRTCYSNSEEACVTVPEGKRCEGGDPYIDNLDTKTPEMSLTWDCSGYKEEQMSFPCAKHSPGLHGSPGDLSVYFSCEKKGNQYVALCQTCNKSNWGCFNNTKGVKECVANCLRGNFRPYLCERFTPREYPCTREGGYFAHPRHTSFYFKCIKFRGEFEALCYPCAYYQRTCFSNELQHCIDTGPPYDIHWTCGNKDTILFPNHGTIKSSLTWDAQKLNQLSHLEPPIFPCLRLGEGKHHVPGDRSIYVICTKVKNIKGPFEGALGWNTTFYNCGSKKDQGFFNKKTKQCESMKNWNKYTGEPEPTPPPPPPSQPAKKPSYPAGEPQGIYYYDIFVGSWVKFENLTPPKPPPKKHKAKPKRVKIFGLFR